MSKEFIFELDNALYNEETGEAVFKPKVKGELVRCRECVRGYQDEEPQNDGKKYVWCKHWHAWKPEDGFCDVGDRKDGAE